VIGPARVKHNIKRIDRLLGNRHLAAEQREVYQALAHRTLGTLREPLIIVDWSDLRVRNGVTEWRNGVRAEWGQAWLIAY
jgi:hypothetical protein